MYSQKSAICSLNRWFHYTNEIRGLLPNAIKNTFAGIMSECSLHVIFFCLFDCFWSVDISDQLQNTAVVVIN